MVNGAFVGVGTGFAKPNQKTAIQKDNNVSNVNGQLVSSNEEVTEDIAGGLKVDHKSRA